MGGEQSKEGHSDQTETKTQTHIQTSNIIQQNVVIHTEYNLNALSSDNRNSLRGDYIGHNRNLEPLECSDTDAIVNFENKADSQIKSYYNSNGEERRIDKNNQNRRRGFYSRGPPRGPPRGSHFRRRETLQNTPNVSEIEVKPKGPESLKAVDSNVPNKSNEIAIKPNNPLSKTMDTPKTFESSLLDDSQEDEFSNCSLEDAVKFYKKQKLIFTGNLVGVPNINRQTCSKCLNYLSFEPVTILKTGQFNCGRKDCFDENRSINGKRYNNHFKESYFKCVNHYSGCKVVLKFSDKMKEHELVCEYKQKYNCNECNFFGNGCQLTRHYKEEHPNNYAEDGVFQIKKDVMRRSVLYPADDNLIIIKLEITRQLLELTSNILNPHNCSVPDQFSIVFFCPKTRIFYGPELIDFETNNFRFSLSFIEKHVSSKLLFGAIQIHTKEEDSKSVHDVEIRDDSFTKSLKNILSILSKIDMNCCNCNEIIVNKKDLLICPQGYFSCKICINRYCKICDNLCFWWDMNTIFKNLKLVCDWNNCNKVIDCLDFINHKQICRERQYQCPSRNCEFSGNSQELKNHWHNVSRLVIDSVLDFRTTESENIYWIVDYFREMLFVKIVKVDGYVYIEIYETMTIFPNNYTLELFYEYYNTYSLFEKLIQKGDKKTHHYSIHRYESWRLIARACNQSIVNDIGISLNQKVNSESVLKELLKLFFKLTVSCCNCNEIIKNKTEIFLCQRSHVVCKNCNISKCDSCKDDNVQFIKLTTYLLSDLKFSCDWTGCSDILNWWDFLQHTQICKMRKFECPVCLSSKNTFVGSKKELQLHWHKKEIKLKFGAQVDFQIENSNKTIYWITEYVNELLVIYIEVNQKDRRLEIQENFAILSNSYKINLLEFNESLKRFSKIEELKQAGGCKKSLTYLANNKSYRLTLNKIQ